MNASWPGHAPFFVLIIGHLQEQTSGRFRGLGPSRFLRLAVGLVGKPLPQLGEPAVEVHARELGDLRENADYEAARREQSFLEGRVAQIEAMIAEFERISTELDREIKLEQDRAGIHDPGHFAYPTYAKAAMTRRENLKRSADELKTQLDDAKAVLGEAFEELKKVEMLDERDKERDRVEQNAREQQELDRIATMRFTAGGAHI